MKNTYWCKSSDDILHVKARQRRNPFYSQIRCRVQHHLNLDKNWQLHREFSSKFLTFLERTW